MKQWSLRFYHYLSFAKYVKEPKKKAPETGLKAKTPVDVRPQPLKKVIPQKAITVEEDEEVNTFSTEATAAHDTRAVSVIYGDDLFL